MTRKAIIIFCLTISFSGVSNGQINIESKRKNLSENRLTANISSYLTLNSGNTELVKFDNSGALFYKRNRHLTFLIASFSLGEKSDQKFINKGMGHLRYNYDVHENTAVEVFLQGEYNEFTLLNFRGLFGGGIRMILYDTNKLFTVFGTGAINEREELDLSEDLIQTTETARSSSYLGIDIKLTDLVDFSLTGYFQPAFEDFTDYRILLDSFLEIKILKQLSFITSLNLRYDNLPPLDIEKQDLELKNGIVLHM